MFSTLTISIIAGIGSTAWFYSKMMRQTGNNTQTSVIVAIGGGLVVAVIFGTIASNILG